MASNPGGGGHDLSLRPGSGAGDSPRTVVSTGNGGDLNALQTDTGRTAIEDRPDSDSDGNLRGDLVAARDDEVRQDLPQDTPVAVPLVAQGENASGTDNVLAFRATSGTDAKKRARATSGTNSVSATKSIKKPSGAKKPAKPPTPAGHEWRYADSGWALYRRMPILTEAGKRSSQRVYLGFYTQAAIERLYGTNRKTAANS